MPTPAATEPVPEDPHLPVPTTPMPTPIPDADPPGPFPTERELRQSPADREVQLALYYAIQTLPYQPAVLDGALGMLLDTYGGNGMCPLLGVEILRGTPGLAPTTTSIICDAIFQQGAAANGTTCPEIPGPLLGDMPATRAPLPPPPPPRSVIKSRRLARSQHALLSMDSVMETEAPMPTPEAPMPTPEAPMPPGADAVALSSVVLASCGAQATAASVKASLAAAPAILEAANAPVEEVDEAA